MDEQVITAGVPLRTRKHTFDVDSGEEAWAGGTLHHLSPHQWRRLIPDEQHVGSRTA